MALFTGTPLNLVIADASSKEIKNKNPTGIFPFIEQGEDVVADILPICKHLCR